MKTLAITAPPMNPPTLGLYLPYSTSRFMILSSSPPVYIGDLNPNKRLPDSEVEAIGRNILDEKRAIFEELQVPVKTKLIIKEDPEDYIIRIAKKKKFDLVIVGCKGIHSKLSQIFIGSVAQHVVANVPCDVLVVK